MHVFTVHIFFSVFSVHQTFFTSIFFGVNFSVYTKRKPFLFFYYSFLFEVQFFFFFLFLIFLQLSQKKKAKVETDLEALQEQIKKDMPLINSWRSKLLFSKEQYLDDLIQEWRKLPLVHFLSFFLLN